MGLVEWSKNNNPRKIIYADEKDGKKIQDVWEYKDTQSPTYPTQKNLNMLEMIILNSSNKNSVVLDCFCGSGTTLEAAAKLGRTFMSIDSSEQAVLIAQKNLNQKNIDFNVINAF